jgi:DNA replication protein DnaC
VITSDEGAIAAIDAGATELKLPTLKAESARLAVEAKQGAVSYLGYLAECIAVEVDSRTQRRIARRILEARFPRIKTLDDFDTNQAHSSVTPALVGSLRSGRFIGLGHPLVFLGDSGTGKSHLLIGTGVAAAKAGKRVRYVTCAQLVNELSEAQNDKMLSRIVARYGRLDLLCLDEVGYVHLDPRGAELLFQVITEREEKGSIAVASNAPFSEWGKVFTDARLVAAVIDRLTFNATIIECGTDSYRFKTTKSARSSDTK